MSKWSYGTKVLALLVLGLFSTFPFVPLRQWLAAYVLNRLADDSLMAFVRRVPSMHAVLIAWSGEFVGAIGRLEEYCFAWQVDPTSYPLAKWKMWYKKREAWQRVKIPDGTIIEPLQWLPWDEPWWLIRKMIENAHNVAGIVWVGWPRAATLIESNVFWSTVRHGVDRNGDPTNEILDHELLSETEVPLGVRDVQALVLHGAEAVPITLEKGGGLAKQGETTRIQLRWNCTFIITILGENGVMMVLDTSQRTGGRLQIVHQEVESALVYQVSQMYPAELINRAAASKYQKELAVFLGKKEAAKNVLAKKRNGEETEEETSTDTPPVRKGKETTAERKARKEQERLEATEAAPVWDYLIEPTIQYIFDTYGYSVSEIKLFAVDPADKKTQDWLTAQVSADVAHYQATGIMRIAGAERKRGSALKTWPTAAFLPEAVKGFRGSYLSIGDGGRMPVALPAHERARKPGDRDNNASSPFGNVSRPSFKKDSDGSESTGAPTSIFDQSSSPKD